MINLLVSWVLGGSPQLKVPPPEERCQAVLAMLHGGVACRDLPPPGAPVRAWTALHRTDRAGDAGERFLQPVERCADATFTIEATPRPSAATSTAFDLHVFATASAVTLRFHLFALPTTSDGGALVGGLGAVGSEAWKTERGWDATFPAADGSRASGPCRLD